MLVFYEISICIVAKRNPVDFDQLMLLIVFVIRGLVYSILGFLFLFYIFIAIDFKLCLFFYLIRVFVFLCVFSQPPRTVIDKLFIPFGSLLRFFKIGFIPTHRLCGNNLILGERFVDFRFRSPAQIISGGNLYRVFEVLLYNFCFTLIPVRGYQLLFS